MTIMEPTFSKPEKPHQHEVHYRTSDADKVSLEDLQQMRDLAAPHPVAFVMHSDAAFDALCPEGAALFIHCTEVEDFDRLLAQANAASN